MIKVKKFMKQKNHICPMIIYEILTINTSYFIDNTQKIYLFIKDNIDIQFYLIIQINKQI